jgi:ferric-dicitrate binding protein FerR (iron transport regulator)
MRIAPIGGISQVKETAMPHESPENIRARAIEWHIRLRDGDDATWETFAEWLAEDARHAEAYDGVEAADLAIDPLWPHVVIREADGAGALSAARSRRRSSRPFCCFPAPRLAATMS